MSSSPTLPILNTGMSPTAPILCLALSACIQRTGCLFRSRRPVPNVGWCEAHKRRFTCQLCTAAKGGAKKTPAKLEQLAKARAAKAAKRAKGESS